MVRYEVHRWLAREVGVLLAVLLSLVALVGALDPAGALLVGIVAYTSTLVGGVVPDAAVGEPGLDATYSSEAYRYLVALGRFVLAVVALLALLALDHPDPVVAGGLVGVAVVAVSLAILRALPDLLHRYIPWRWLPVELSYWTLMSLGAIVAVRLVLRALDVEAFATQYLPLAVGVPVVVGIVAHISLDAARGPLHRYAPVPVERRVLRRELSPTGSTVVDRLPHLVRFAFDQQLAWRARGIVLLAVAAPVVALVAVWLALYYFLFVPMMG